MSKKKRNRTKDLGIMIGEKRPGCVVRGGKEVTIENWDELVAEYKRGMPVMPPRVIILGEQGLKERSPAAVAFEELARFGRLPAFMKTFFDWPSADGLGNAHEVAQALMFDLVLAQRSAGWHLVRADVRMRFGHSAHSWLEYKGWAVDGACGLVRIWPALHYRAVRDARNATERDAEQVRAGWRRHTDSLDPLIAQEMEASRAHVLDLANGAVTDMPAEELAPGMVLGQAEGLGAVWVDRTTITPNTTLRNPPFSPETKERVGRIADALREVDPLTLEQWELTLRVEPRMEREIFLHECIAEAYARMVQGHDLTRGQKVDYYHALLAATLSDRQNFSHVFQPRVISRQEAISAADMFHRVFRERGGPEKCKQWPAPKGDNGTTGTAA